MIVVSRVAQTMYELGWNGFTEIRLRRDSSLGTGTVETIGCRLVLLICCVCMDELRRSGIRKTRGRRGRDFVLIGSS